MGSNTNDPDYYDDYTSEYSSLVETLDQDEFWGRPDNLERIEDLTADHICNIIQYLHRSAASLKFEYDYSFLRYPEPSGEQAQIEVDHGYSMSLAQSAQDWLSETPLMRRLVEIHSKAEGK